MDKILVAVNSSPSIRLLLVVSVCITIGYIIQYFIRLIIARNKAVKERGVLMQIIPPKYQSLDADNFRGERFALQRFFDDLTAATKKQRVSFEIYSDEKGIKFVVWTPTKKIQNLIKQSLFTTYKQRIKFENIEHDPLIAFTKFNSKVSEYRTAKHPVYLLMDLKDFDAVDPIDGIINAMSGLGKDEKMYFQIVLSPAKRDRQAIAKAKENFRVKKGDITWYQMFFRRFETYLIYLVPLFPFLLLVGIGELMKMFNSRSSLDPFLSLPDSDPRKVLAQSEEIDDFNKQLNEKFKTPFYSYIRVAVSGTNNQELIVKFDQALETMKSVSLNSLIRRNSNKLVDLKQRFIYPEDTLFPFYKEIFTSQTTLSSREVSMMYHFPAEILNPAVESFVFVNVPARDKFRSKTNKDDLLLGINQVNDKERSVYLSTENRKRHMTVTGQTGTGKSTILKNFVLQDIDNRIFKGIKRGLVLLDPHEDFFTDVLHKLHKSFTYNKSLIIWDTRSEDFFLGYNPLYAVDLSEREIDMLVDSNFEFIEKLVRRVTPDGGMGVTAKPMLKNSMKTLMVFQNEWLNKHGRTEKNIETIKRYAPTLNEIKEVFFNDQIKNSILSSIDITKYESLRSFWQNTLMNYQSSKAWPDIRQAFDNKLSQILTGSLFYTFSQSQNSIDISDCIRRSRILLVNLSSKNIGIDGMQLLGSLLMSKLWFEAKRVEQEERHPFVIYADEFQNFANSDFAVALSEARKFKLELVLAHQFFAQLPDEVSEAVTGNVKTRIYYRAGLDDALKIADDLQMRVLKNEVLEIPEFHSYVRVGEDVFSITVPKERENNFSNDAVESFIDEAYQTLGKSKIEIVNEIKSRLNWYNNGCKPIN
jgi:hypothetical protein